jgi:hypothetical protein
MKCDAECPKFGGRFGVGLVSRECGEGVIMGKLVVWLKGKRLYVCHAGFDKVDADVACKQMGYAQGRIVGETTGKLRKTNPPKPAIKFGMYDVNCKGSERKLQNCEYSTKQSEGGVCGFAEGDTVQRWRHTAHVYQVGQVMFRNARKY